MIVPETPTLRSSLLTAAASLVVVTASSPAAVKTWDGQGDANWQSAANWDADTAPLAGDSLVFQGSAGLSNTNDFPADTRFAGIGFAAEAGAFTLAGNAVTLAGGVSNASPAVQTVGTALKLAGGTYAFTGSATTGATLALGSVTAPAAAGGAAVFTPGEGGITTATSNVHGILGAWATIGSTTNGVDWAAADGGGAVGAYTGYTDLAAAGTITSDPAANVRMLGTANLGGASADINTLKSSAATGNGNDVTGIGEGNTLRFGIMGGILNDTNTGNNMRIGGNTGNTGIGAITAGGPDADTPGTLVINASATASSHNNVIGILSTITDNGGGAVTVVKTGLSSCYFQSANSYSGGTFINQGHIQANSGSGFGSGPVAVASGAQAFLNQGNGTFPNDFTVAGVGLTADAVPTGALRLSNNTVMSGTLTLAADSRVNVNGNTLGAITGKITGPGGLEFFANGGANSTPRLRLANPENDWAGDTAVTATVATATTTLILGDSEVIPHGAGAGDVSIGSRTALTTGFSRIDLAGFDETVNGLNSGVSARFHLTNTAEDPAVLTLGAGDADGDFGGSILDVSPANAISLVKTGSGTQIIRGGTSAYYGTTQVNAGRLEFVGNVVADGAVTVADGAVLATDGLVTGPVTLQDGALLVPAGTATLSALAPEAGSAIEIDASNLLAAPLTVTGAITPAGGAGSVTLHITGLAPLPGSYPLISYAGGSLDGTGFPAFTLGTLPGRLAATLVHDAVSQQILLDVSSSGDSIAWNGALSSEWSLATLDAPKNWELASAPVNKTDFIAGDLVVFPDGAARQTVDISVEDVTPGMTTFENSTDSYLLTGSKGISGTGSLVLAGGGTVTITNDNSYTGDTVIAAGTLEVGDGGSSGTIGSGQVANDGTLSLNRGDETTLANTIIGSGALLHEGEGTTTLSGANGYSGTTTVAAGILRVTNSNSLGSPGGGAVQVQAGAALDFGGGPAGNAMNLGPKLFLISGDGPSGDGALVNMGANTQNNAFQTLALEADASLGGSNRFDLRGAGSDLGLNGHVLRKRGAGQFSIVNSLIHGGGGIIVEEGTLAIEAAARTDGSGAITYEAGTQALFYQNDPADGGITWTLTLGEGVNFGNAGNGLATLPAPVVLEGNVQFVGYNAGVPAPGFNRPLTLTGNITENGGSRSITKEGNSVVTLTGDANTYTGTTAVNGGAMVVDGTVSSSPFTVAAGATLGGTGTIGGTVAGQGVISPGMALTGTLGTGAATLSATGSLAIQIDSGTLACDKLAVNGTLGLGGALLEVTDLGGTVLPADTKFVIASHGGISGAFANAPDGGTLAVGPNTFTVDYDEVVSGVPSITLTVSAGSAYDEWASASGLDGTNNGKMDDPDGDGLENVIEFALNQDPLAAGSAKVRAALADVDPGAPVLTAYTLTVAMRSGADFTGSAPGDLLSQPVDGVIYRVEGSATLDDFPLDITEITPALSEGMEEPDAGWSYRSFRLPGSPGSQDPKGFLRVDVAEDL